MEGILTLVNRWLAPFRSRDFECSESMREVAEMQADVRWRLDRLEKEIRRAEMNGEERWFLTARKRGDDDG